MHWIIFQDSVSNDWIAELSGVKREERRTRCSNLYKESVRTCPVPMQCVTWCMDEQVGPLPPSWLPHSEEDRTAPTWPVFGESKYRDWEHSRLLSARQWNAAQCRRCTTWGYHLSADSYQSNDTFNDDCRRLESMMYRWGALNVFIALELSPRQHKMIYDWILT